MQLTYTTTPHHTHTHTHTHKQLLEARVAALTQQQQRKSEREKQMKKKSEVSEKITQCCFTEMRMTTWVKTSSLFSSSSSLSCGLLPFSHLTQSLQMECSVLRDSLSDFSHWTRQKLQLLEDDLDIFRVVYSLHGSLSKVSGGGGRGETLILCIRGRGE